MQINKLLQPKMDLGRGDLNALGHGDSNCLGRGDPNCLGHDDPNCLGRVDPKRLGRGDPNCLGHGNANFLVRVDPNFLGCGDPNFLTQKIWVGCVGTQIFGSSLTTFFWVVLTQKFLQCRATAVRYGR